MLEQPHGPGRGGHTHKGLRVWDTVVPPCMCHAPHKAQGSLENGSHKESKRPRNGSSHLHCSLFPSGKCWVMLAPSVIYRNQEEIPKPPTFACFRNWLKCPLKANPKGSMKKLSMVLGDLLGGQENPLGLCLVLGSALGICCVSAGRCPACTGAACSSPLPVRPVTCLPLGEHRAERGQSCDFPGDPWAVLTGAIKAHPWLPLSNLRGGPQPLVQWRWCYRQVSRPVLSWTNCIFF